MTLQDDRLAVSIALPGGQLKRWGADERAVGDIPKGLSFGTSDPGGFKDFQVTLARGQQAWPDLQLLADLRCYGRGNRTAWEGRLQETPSQAGAEESWSPGAVGWSAHLEDDPSFAELYVSRDLNEWQPQSRKRRKAQLDAFRTIFEPSVDVDKTEGIPALALTVSDTWGAPGAFCEDYFDAGPGRKIAAVSWDRLSKGGTAAGSPSELWVFQVAGFNDDACSGEVASGDYHTAAEDSDPYTTFAFTPPKQVAGFFWYIGAAGGTAGASYTSWVRRVAVWGNHGLPKIGQSPGQGYAASDVIANVIGRVAPKIRLEPGAIAASTFPIPHLVFNDPVTAAAVIEAVNAFHQYTWGVGDNRTFFWRPTTAYRKRWRVRRSRGDEIDLLGAQAEDTINGVVCGFTDPSGEQRIVGPPGTISAVATSEELRDTSPNNPVNLAGIARKWAIINLSFTTDVTGALQVARAYLQTRLLYAASRGSVKIIGDVEDEHGVLHPAWAVRAGDSVTPVDGDGIERPVISTNYEHDSRTNTADADATPHRWEAVQEQMGVVLIGAAD